MKKIFLTALIGVQVNVFAQTSLPVYDSMPVINEGLKAGYDITGASEKEVGDKGNFSRYKIRFYVANTSSEAKLILYKPNSFNFGGSVSPDLVQFKCSNATGARLTNKEATLKANPCIIDALVDEPDASSGKTVQKKKPANIGYWIKPGESITANTIMIVPLNEKPKMTVSFFPNSASMGAAVVNNNNNGYTTSNNNNSYNNGQNNSNNGYTNSQNNNNSQSNYFQGFLHIKNFSSNYYINNENGPAACTSIDYGWWSSQWEILPVNGTNYFVIKNRWKNTFISTDNNSMLSANGQSANSMWSVEEIGNTHTYSIKNAANNTSLVFQDGVLKTAVIFSPQPYTQWIIEQ
jgi:hypothetical protein